jgi:hypothetical protein
MCCEHLICANCSGPVVEGRCSVCRQGRQQFGHGSGGLPVQALFLLILAMGIAVTLLTTMQR